MFFSAHRIIGTLFRKIHRAIQQHLKTGGRIAEMHPHHAVVNLPPIAVVLPTDAHRFFATLGRSRLIHAPDRLGRCMVGGDDLLAPISQFFFIPLDRFEKAL
jgi:hypothetical protein